MEHASHIRSIGRSLAVLRAVNQAGALTIMEIARAVGLPYPTAFRIVSTLQDEGMLEREDARKHFRPTALVQSLSHGYQDHSNLVEVAHPHLESLTRSHFWPISLTTRVGQLMIVRDCTHARSAMALTNYQPGATFPLLECASGHVMLAFAEDEQRHAWLDAAMTCDLPPDRLTLSQLRSGEFASKIRNDGYALSRHNRFTNTPGRTSSLAVPIFLNGEVCGALTLVYFSVAMQADIAVERYVADLKDKARAITIRLAGDRAPAPRPSQGDVQAAELGVAQ